MPALLILGILGWFGSVWWPGIEVDAPRPGGGDPWWTRLLLGAVGAVSAIVVARISGGGLEPVAGAILAIAAGRVGAGIVGALLAAARR
ncbi:MAG: hypothetical protein QOJ27_1215 [Sphingomonadales bacterium]|nr:hypothetical protein [Sphingomonadales bacterium]